MAISPDSEMESPTTARVDVRVPRDSDADLETDAERRLSRADGVSDATVDELCGMEPRLSATIVTVAVTVRSTADRVDVRDRLAAAPGVESVECRG